MQLYEKIQTGKTTRYKPYVQPVPKRSEFSDKELITMAASFGLIVLMETRRLLPEHKFVARKVRAVEEAILDLTKGVDGPLDVEVIEYWANVWDRVLVELSKDLGGVA